MTIEIDGEFWWPVERPEGVLPRRAGEMIYSVLGPHATAELIDALSALECDDDSVLPAILGQLKRVDGRFPTLLAALAITIGAANRYSMRKHNIDIAENEQPTRATPVDTSLEVTLKHCGGLLEEAWVQFGFDEEDFRDWFERQNLELGFEDVGEWPPVELDYFTDRPTSGPHLPLPEHDDCSEPAPDRFQVMIDRLSWRTGASGILSPGPSSIPDLNVGSLAPPKPSADTSRGLARLMAATVQHLHSELAGPPGFPINIDPSPPDDPCWANHRDEYAAEQEILRIMTMAPEGTWPLLTPARRTCLVADLGELLRITIHLGEGDLRRETARVLANVCGGDTDLIEVARLAGGSLGYTGSLQAFEKTINTIRALHWSPTAGMNL